MISIDSSLVFKGINFAIMSAVIVYILKQYLLPAIHLQINQENATAQELATESELLRTQMQQLEKKMIEEQEQQQRLRQHLLQWNHALEQQRHEQQRVYTALQQTLQERAQERQRQKEQYDIMRITLPQALNQAQDLLMQEMSAAQIKEYNQRIFTYLHNQGNK